MASIFVTAILILVVCMDYPTLSMRVCVIGGGAAGYFAAIQCGEVMRRRKGERDLEKVTIFEGSRDVLAKVLVSGGGRCNVQHDPRKAVDDIAKGYPRGRKELLGPLRLPRKQSTPLRKINICSQTYMSERN